MADELQKISPVSQVLRSPPHSLDAEEYLLSCCFLDGDDVMSRCLEAKLSDGSFFAPANRIIFSCLMALYEKRRPIDLHVLIEELRTSRQLEEVGGVAYLAQLSSKIPTTAQVGYFIEKVRELQLLRALIGVSTRAVESCYQYDGEGGFAEFFDKVEKDVFEVTQDRVSDSVRQMLEPTNEAMKVIHKMLEKKGEMTGVASGFSKLDALTYGFQRQEMIILAARPSMGKTSLALNFAEAAAFPRHGEAHAVLLFSLEMSSAQLAMRMLCSRSRVNMKLLREGLLPKGGGEMQRIAEAADEFSKSPIYIDDSSQLTIMQLRAKARRLAAKVKLGFIMVDYLQLLSPTDPRVPREQQVAEMSRGLKALAKELDVPVLVLSQLNRETEKTGEGTPKLSNLRESGSIEQDADVVLMIARPKGADSKFQVAADEAELIIAKNRNGAVGDLKLTFLRDITRFENYLGGEPS